MIEYEKEILIDVDTERDGKTVYITLHCAEEPLNAYDVKTAIAQHFAEDEAADEDTGLLH